jgi:hypothetical protein
VNAASPDLSQGIAQVLMAAARFGVSTPLAKMLLVGTGTRSKGGENRHDQEKVLRKTVDYSYSLDSNGELPEITQMWLATRLNNL